MSCTANPAHSGYLAVNYCFQCQQFLCSLCKTIHDTLNKEHSISDEEISIDKICDRHIEGNEIISHCAECNMNLCSTCLKEHNIHHDIYDIKTFFPKNLCDKYYEDFKLIHITFFKYINEAKKIIDEKILEEKRKEEDDTNKNEELKTAVKNMNCIYEKNNEMNQDLIKLISLMFENYYNTIESTPYFNIIYQLKSLTRFNSNLKSFKYDENISLIENITNFINYLKKVYIIKTIDIPLEIKEITKIPKLNNTRVLISLGGTKLASGNMESDIQIFDLNSKNVVKHIVGHFFSVTSMCFVDNKYIISGGSDTAMNIYDPSIFIDNDETNDDMRENCYRGFLSGHDDTICKIMQFKDGKVATCGYDKKINIFGKCQENKAKEDFPVIELTEEEKEKLEKEKSQREKTEKSENENNITNTNNSNNVEEIQAQPQPELFYLNLENLACFELPDKVFDICEAKDGSLIACCLDKSLKIYNMENLSSPQPEKEIKLDYTPTRIACLPDGRIVVAFGENPNFGIKIYKLDENKELILQKEFIEHQKLISCLYILEDGKIVTTSMDGTAVFYNPFDFNIVCKIEENKKKNFTSVVQLEDRSVVISAGKGIIYVLQ
jgi:WD40 repeat protein